MESVSILIAAKTVRQHPPTSSTCGPPTQLRFNEEGTTYNNTYNSMLLDANSGPWMVLYTRTSGVPGTCHAINVFKRPTPPLLCY